MDKYLKFFPLMPAPEQTDKLIWAIVFYFVAIPAISAIICFVLGLTIILAPLGIILGLACSAYSITGIIFAILCYTGQANKE